MSLDYENLEVYQAALNLVVLADTIAQHLPKGRAKLADQMSRAAMSIPLNIAEGAGRMARGDKQQSYRIARGSAMECGAILDVCVRLSLLSEERRATAKAMVERVVAMLSKLIESVK